MQLTAKEIWGGVTAFLANPQSVGLGRIRFATNYAVQRMHNQLKDQWSRKTEDLVYLDLGSNIDEYPIPPEINHITKIVRFDLGPSEVRVFPKDYHSHDEQDEMGQNLIYRYEIVPGRRIRFLQIPSGNYDKGARITHMPMALRLETPTQIPRLPEDLHEGVIVEAVGWLVGSGAQIGNVQTYGVLKQQCEADLIKYLNPNGQDAPPGVIEDYPTYEPEWDPYI